MTTKGPGPPQFNFCQPIKIYIPAEIKSLKEIKIATSGCHQTFSKRNAIARA